MLQKCELSQKVVAPTQMIANKQAMMVQKCKRENKKELQTSAPQSCAKDQNVILPISKKKSH
jgi:hypothetical protein